MSDEPLILDITGRDTRRLSQLPTGYVIPKDVLCPRCGGTFKRFQWLPRPRLFWRACAQCGHDEHLAPSMRQALLPTPDGGRV